MNSRTGWPWRASAALVMVAGALLRLYALDAMEFKGDERESLLHAVTFITDHPWSSDKPWPVIGLMSSNGVGNAPLFTWIIAALWAPTRHPVTVTAAIAIINVLALYPLWRWARRRMDEFRALVTLAIVSGSPFFVLFSRKIWAPDLMLAALLCVLWGVEWWRHGRPWRGLALFLMAVLVIGQLHQSGPIALVVFPVALAIQWLFDRMSEAPRARWHRPSLAELVAIAAAVGVNLFLWIPYVQYFLSVPASTFARRPTIEAIQPELLRKMALQIVPTDLFYFFDPHRFPFLDDDWRRWSYTAAVYTGVPLLVYGFWRWLRRPQSLPVIGVWWWLIVAAFAALRILTHPYYALILAPITAVLPAGVFDRERLPIWFDRALAVTRVVYVIALFALSATTLTWLAGRGGAAGEYGVAYSVRESQARFLASGIATAAVVPASLKCHDVPVEVSWIADWRAPSRANNDQAMQLCDDWEPDPERGYVYRWQFKAK